MVPLIVEEFGYVGGEGSPVHGDPRYLMAVPLMKQVIVNLIDSEASKSLESSFSIIFCLETLLRLFLEPEDLINMGQSIGLNNAEVMDDGYFVIPDDQQQILNSITTEQLTSALYLSLEYFLDFPTESEPVDYSMWLF